MPTPLLPFSIPALLEGNAALFGDRPALLGPGLPPTSHRQLWEQAQATVRRLRALGIGRGDRVAIVLPQGPEPAAAFLAVACGATAAPLNPAYLQSDFAFYLRDLQAKALIVPLEGHPAAEAAAAALGVPVLGLVPLAEGAGRFDLAGQAVGPARDDGLAGAEEVGLVMHTSGTTARPKIVPLTHANLCAAAVGAGGLFALSPSDICLNVMPMFHGHGLVSCLLAALARGGATVCLRAFSAADFLADLEIWRPTWYSAVPTLHQAILAELEGLPWPVKTGLRGIRSGSAALPPPVLAGLEKAFGVPVIEFYGLTEALHLTSNPLPPRARKPGSGGLSTGSEVAILDEAGGVLGPGRTGEVAVASRGANLAAGYENDPEATAAAHTPGWFRTGDQGYLDEEGYLFITGRFKEQINRGGEKVSPSEIDAVLLSHPGVSQAAAFAVPHPMLGEDVAAVVVLKAGAAAGEPELRGFALDRLPPFKVPTRIIQAADIPRGPTGKVRRAGLADRFAGELAVCHAEPQTDSQRALARIWREALRRDRIGIHDNFFDLGGYSLLAVQVCARVRERMGRELPVRAFVRMPTVAALAAWLDAPDGPGESGQGESGGHWVTLQQGDPRKPLLVILPGGAGTERELLVFAQLIRGLPRNQPVVGVNRGSFDPGGRRLPSVETIAGLLLPGVLERARGRPFVLLGECVAGSLAFEMARQAKASGHPVARLILLDARRPSWRLGWWEPFCQWLDALRPAGWRAFLKSPLRHWAAFQARPPTTRKQKLRRNLRRYRPGPLALPVDLFATREFAAASPPDLGWQRYAPDLCCHAADGTHDSYIREPAPAMMAALVGILESVRPAEGAVGGR